MAGELKVETKENEGRSLSFNYPLSELGFMGFMGVV